MNELTPAMLYAMAMESYTADQLMPRLCEALGTSYPPLPDDETVITGKTSLQNFIESYEGRPAPLHAGRFI